MPAKTPKEKLQSNLNYTRFLMKEAQKNDDRELVAYYRGVVVGLKIAKRLIK